MIKKHLLRFYYRLRSNYTTEHLQERGLCIGTGFLRMHDVIIDPSHCWLIEIANNVTLAPRVHILAHDASTKFFLNYTKIGNVKIGDNVFIGADSVILPNVTIGDNVVVGANSTVSKNLKSGGVYAGSPANFICSINEYLDKNQKQMSISPKFEDEYTISAGISLEKKQRMKKVLSDKIGYIK
ncbi:acyltransferase [Chryseobacterium sp.]|uniref:acyltransferase n=1 Tax=Chryseobacterium sp. TaxID=1871047 RepID=UPI002FC8A152